MFPSNPVIVVGGGLAGLCAAHEAYLRGANVVLLDKQGFLSGNSGKATSGINGALTRTQVSHKIDDSVEKFYQDTLATAKDRANPALIRVLTYNSADAVHWLQEQFGLDLSVVSRLGGHSQPRTHRGHDAKFPGMAITYRLLETLETLAQTEPHRVCVLKHTQVVDLVVDDGDRSQVRGVRYKELKTKSRGTVSGPVIMATGGYAADFSKNSLLRKYRPDIFDLPSTNGSHATGDGQKIIMKNAGVAIDMDKVQVHPTGLIEYDDAEVVAGRKTPRFLFLGAEALRGEGGVILNARGQRFCDELGTRDYVSAEMHRQLQEGNGPLRLVLSADAAARLQFHVKHYEQRKLMRTVSGARLADEMGVLLETLQTTFAQYNKAAAGSQPDRFGKKYFPATPFAWAADDSYHVSFITRVLHFTMGGVKIDHKSRVIHTDGDKETPFKGLYAAGEVAGGVHGHNRLGGSSLLACVVYGRLAADQATSFLLRHLSHASAVLRLRQINLHIDPESKKVTIDLGDSAEIEQSSSRAVTSSPHAEPVAPKARDLARFRVPDQQYTAEEVAKHNSESDCWVIVKNVVLDLTSFLSEHPGGKESIVKFAGQDATTSFDMLHEDNVIPRYAAECVIGRLKGKTPLLELK